MIAQLKKVSLPTILAITAMAFGNTSWANLLNNGEFEDQVVPTGWTHLQDSPDGWQGSDIEIWASGFRGVNSHSGSQHGELNSHGGDGSDYGIHQSFDTSANVEYLFSFAYQARANSEESFLFLLTDGNVGGAELLSGLMTDHTKDGWSTFHSSFVAAGDTTTLQFGSISPGNGTVGNFLDSIVVTAAPVPPTAAVPSPGSIALLGLGLISLSLSSRRKKAA